MNKKFNRKIFYTYLASIFLAISINLVVVYYLQYLITVKNVSSGNLSEEGCLTCHGEMSGFEDAHLPEKIGCTSCHLGNRSSEKKEVAHTGLVLIPGNISNAEKTCGRINCHPQMLTRMQDNIMNTMNGVVSVDKWVFNEADSPTFKLPIQKIGNSKTELHLRNLCASCHLSNEKNEFGPITELSRGGGCLACHLNYSEKAYTQLMKIVPKHEGQSSHFSTSGFRFKETKNRFVPNLHPQVNLKITNTHCFGCHSRSGRISLNYDGWSETVLSPEGIKADKNFRILDDERVVKKIQSDIHSDIGLICVDCHNSYEVMGDGKYNLHKEDQMKIQCVDCHLISTPKTLKLNELDYESKKIAELLGYDNYQRNYLTTRKNKIPILNSFFESGTAKLISKADGKIFSIKTPAAFCIEEKAHQNLSCNSCHSSWTPQCVGCHTEYDKAGTMYDLLANKETKGEWLEYPNDLLAEQSVLGIQEIKQNDGMIKKIVGEFSPGMILTIDKKDGSKKIFKRLFAPGFSHTIRKESRSCESCHNNPLALGYGRGHLEYLVSGKNGKWLFKPRYSISKFDGLPEDAWIGFMKQRSFTSTTRDNTRPFTIDEQKKILTVGACLTCHKSNSSVMKMALNNFEKTKILRNKKCVFPFR